MEFYLAMGAAVVALALLWFLKRPDISSTEARRLVAEGARLVDVRSPGEFVAGHIAGAQNLPVGEIGRRSADLGSTEQAIVLYCASGMRSAMAARTLRNAGYARVYNLGPMSK